MLQQWADTWGWELPKAWVHEQTDHKYTLALQLYWLLSMNCAVLLPQSLACAQSCCRPWRQQKGLNSHVETIKSNQIQATE